MRHIRLFTTVLLGVLTLYFVGAALVLRFGMDRLLFPRTPAFTGPQAEAMFSIKSDSGNKLLVRRYGQARLGCILFFPGQHGAGRAYNFTDYVSSGFAVFQLAYPGQDGAAGRARLGEIEKLAGDAVHTIGEACPADRIVFIGVSLGGMLGAYAVKSGQPAGLVLVSAAPSMSSAIRVRLQSHVALAPIAWLPLSHLVPHDYSLAEALARAPGIPVVIFQGTQDDQTPIELLRSSDIPDGEVKVLEVTDATHSNAFSLSSAAQVSAILAMLPRNGT